ncbi:MAG: MBL fold metallo-hydrolase [Clostridium sp.]|uniref:MBL fold metallo-hydrolase n=1 Tax=Clostridium sp. TaxID=1506 RepID=UPI003F2DC210
MQIEKIITGLYEENTYLLIDENTKFCAIVDPGDEEERIIEKIENLQINPKFIILTHAHFDHVGAVEALMKKYNIPFYMHKNEEEYVEKDSTVFGNLKKADKFVNEGDEIALGNTVIKVIHTPGHTKGGVCYLADNKLISGDTLFNGSVGRADFPGGNMSELLSGINEKLFTLDSNIEVYPGHGPKTTIGYEKNNNPFFRM